MLGELHAADVPEASDLKRYETPPDRSADWVEGHAARARAAMGAGAATHFSVRLAERLRRADVPVLPLSGCCFDFKASNLVFAPKPILIDPDHAALIPRVYDLAIAALLFHNDAPRAPGRLWRRREWRSFLSGYTRRVKLTTQERASWPEILRRAWLDQGVWLLGNFPEGWDNPREAAYLRDLATADLALFALD